MSLFTTDDVAEMAKVGNVTHNSLYLARHPKDHTLPNGADIIKLKDFIKQKYLDKRWYGGSDGAVTSTSTSTQRASPFAYSTGKETVSSGSGGSVSGVPSAAFSRVRHLFCTLTDTFYTPLSALCAPILTFTTLPYHTISYSLPLTAGIPSFSNRSRGSETIRFSRFWRRQQWWRW